MATRITLGIDATSREGATRITVQEDFDQVMEKFWPLNPAGSILQQRENNIFTKPSGDRIMVKGPSIVLIEENVDADEEG